MEVTLETLGLSKEDIAERIVDQAVDNLLSSMHRGYNEFGNEVEGSEPTKFTLAMQERIKDRIDLAIDNIAAKHVLPNIEKFIEDFCIQETNKWGEAKGGSLTFVEYLTQRADAYMREQVDYSGKAKGRDSYNWRPAGERLTFLIDQHLQYSISTALKNNLQTVQDAIGESVAATVKTQLKQLTADVKVAVKGK